MERLNQIDMGDQWIEFCGQGQGADPEQTQFETVRFNGRTFDLSGETVNLHVILDSADLSRTEVRVETSLEGRITLPDASPEQRARFLDALFQEQFRIRPFEGEDDYAVGAEW